MKRNIVGYLTILIFPCFYNFCSPMKKDYCRCDKLIHRNFITSSLCGQAALCHWNLYYYSLAFEGKGLQPSQSYLRKAQRAAADIPSYPSLHQDEDCKKDLETCMKLDTEEMFRSQCAKIYGAPNNNSAEPKDDHMEMYLPPDFTINLNRYKRAIARDYVKRDYFEGYKNGGWYPTTCPSHHRAYEFTYYLLFDGASRKYNVTLDVPWNEELGYGKVAKFMQPEVLQDAVDDMFNTWEKHGFKKENIYQRRFCGNSDVFICVDEV